MSVEFKADGTDAWNVTARGMPLSTNGTYTVAGTTLTDHPTSIVLGGQTMQVQVSGSHADVFTTNVNGDTLTLTDQQSQTRFVLTRAK